MTPAIRFAWTGPLLVGLLALGCAQPERVAEAPKPQPWKSRAIPEAKGEIKEVDGKRVQARYKEAPFSGVTANFEKWSTYAYDDAKKYPPPSRAPMPAIKGDPKEGRKLFMSRAKAPCTGCHLIQGDDVWPAGNIGPDVSVIGDRNLPDQYLFDLIYDARVFFPNTTMPPWGTAGMYTPEEIVHVVAFLQTQKGNPPFTPPPPEKDPNRNPDTRAKPVGFGDNLDPTNNPAILGAEGALSLWSKKGPAGKACADCHAGGPEKAMKGVATKYPKYIGRYGRVMSIEDLLAVHTPETTGMEMLAQSPENLNMAMLIKMQSNGMPVSVDVTSPEAKAAYERGKALYFKKVGQRSHACVDCHDKEPGKGGDKYLGGRLLGVAEEGFTKHFPLWRTNFQVVWDIRKRMQWCMLPLGMNYLPADAPEYADLELYLTAFDNGKEMSVPGIRH
jgi:sulfur-oxidizing protein SoxA